LGCLLLPEFEESECLIDLDQFLVLSTHSIEKQAKQDANPKIHAITYTTTRTHILFDLNQKNEHLLFNHSDATVCKLSLHIGFQPAE